MKPDWLPDWRDASAYPDPETTSMDQWAWEFLRRNPEYQQDYADYISIIETAKSGQEIIEKANAMRGKYHLCDPSWPPSEPSPKWDENRLSKPARDLLKESGYDPDGMDSLMNLFGYSPFALGGLKFLINPRETRGLIPKQLGEVAILFDTEFPIRPQLEKAEKILTTMQNALRNNGRPGIKKRLQVYKYPLYLRHLDAEARGATIKEIAEVLFPSLPNDYPDYQGSDSARNHLSAAKRLCDHDYWYLPLMES